MKWKPTKRADKRSGSPTGEDGGLIRILILGRNNRGLSREFEGRLNVKQATNLK
jgi:hypothetical protein